MESYRPYLKTAAAIFVMVWILASAPKSSAQDAYPLQVFRSLFDASQFAEEENWHAAHSHFLKAYDSLSDRQKNTVPPGLIYNLALTNDEMGGRHLAAIAWYRTLLSMDPDHERATSIQDRVLALERESRSALDRQISVLENIFRELRKVADEYWAVPAKDARFTERLRKEDNDIRLGIRKIEAARIAMGDVTRALRILEEFGVAFEGSTDEEFFLVYFMVAVGFTDPAARYSQSTRNAFKTAVNLLGQIHDAARQSCSEGQIWRTFRKWAARTDRNYSDAASFFKDDEGVRLPRLETISVAEIYLPLTEKVLMLGMGQVLYRQFLSACTSEYLPYHTEKLFFELLLTELSRRNYELLKSSDSEGGNAKQRDYVTKYSTFLDFQSSNLAAVRFMSKDIIQQRNGEFSVGPEGIHLSFKTDLGFAEETLPRGHWIDANRVGIYARVIKRFADLVTRDRTPLGAAEQTYLPDKIREIDALLGR